MKYTVEIKEVPEFLFGHGSIMVAGLSLDCIIALRKEYDKRCPRQVDKPTVESIQEAFAHHP